MIAEFKRGIKLIHYGYGLKMNLIGLLFVPLGILICFMGDESYMVLGALYMVLGTLMIVQIMYSLLYSNYVGASPRRRGIEVTIADGINIITGIIGYIVYMIVTVVRLNAAPERAYNIMQAAILGSLGVATVFIMFGACYKFYWVSLILFFVVYFTIYLGGMIFMDFMQFSLNMPWTAGISLVVIAVGVALSCVLRRLLYKKAMSPTAGGSSLRKAMQ